MIALRRLVAFAVLPVALATVPCIAGATSIVPNAIGAPAAQDTTFRPDGNYTLDLAVGGNAVTMTFTVEKKADGTFAGLFKHPEIGELPTTSFKVDGRKLAIEVVTDGGPAKVLLMVNKDNVVEGEWSMEGDGSKVLGKKAG